MTSVSVEKPALLGAQQPRIWSVPEYSSTTGDEAGQLAALAGLHLDPWQQFVLKHSLGEKPNGKWAAFEVGVIVSRQNGKGALLEARELAGLFLLRERLIIHSAHQFDTSLEAFRRLRDLILDTPELAAELKPKGGVKNSHGEEGLELKTGQRIRFRTRTKGGGRGFTGDCLILDEAMDLPVSAHGALLPTLSAVPNPQVWYTGSAVDQHVHDHGLVLASIRERGHAGGDPGLAYFEWSVDSSLEEVDAVADDPGTWAEANPGLGIRIASEHVALERRSMAPRTFAVERLGVGDWPQPAVKGERVIDPALWKECKDVDSEPEHPVVYAVDTRPDRGRTAIALAGYRPDGLKHIEVGEYRPGTGWVVDRCVELNEQHDPVEFVVDSKGPAASLVTDLRNQGLKVREVNLQEHAEGCGLLFDAVEQGTLRHLDTPELTAAVRGASKRPLGDAWAWSRKSSDVDICPLVACTLALWALMDVMEAEFVFEIIGG